MPPKKKPDLRAQLAKAQKRTKEPITKIVVDKPSQPLNIARVRQQGEEEKEIRKFFIQISEMDDIDDINKLVSWFSNQRKGMYHGRKKLIGIIFNTLPPQLYTNFANSYIEQEDAVGSFFNTYITKKDIAKEIQQYNNDQKEDEKERERLQDIAQGLFGDEDDDEDEDEVLEVIDKPVVPKKKYKHTKFVEIDPKTGELVEVEHLYPKKKEDPIKPKQGLTAKDKACISKIHKAPWLDAKIKQIYISSVEGTDITPYIKNDDKTLVHQDITWYLANQKFYMLLCNNIQEQSGTILTIWTPSQEALNVYLAYSTNRGIIVQDETVFEKKHNYEKQERLTKAEKIKEILTQKTTSTLKRIGMKLLSNALHEIAPTIKDYGDGEEENETLYIKKAIDEIDSSTVDVKSFIIVLSELLVYITDLDTELFKNRIRHEYYLPEVLVKLAPGEKFPEALDESIDDEQFETNFQIINEKTEILEKDIQKMYYELLDPTARRDPLPSFQIERAPKKFTGIDTEWGFETKWSCVNHRDI